MTVKSKITNLFSRLENREITADQAIHDFFLNYGGDRVYIPRFVHLKKYKIIKSLKAGESCELVAKRYRVTLTYVRRIKRELV